MKKIRRAVLVLLILVIVIGIVTTASLWNRGNGAHFTHADVCKLTAIHLNSPGSIEPKECIDAQFRSNGLWIITYDAETFTVSSQTSSGRIPQGTKRYLLLLDDRTGKFLPN